MFTVAEKMAKLCDKVRVKVLGEAHPDFAPHIGLSVEQKTPHRAYLHAFEVHSSGRLSRY